MTRTMFIIYDNKLFRKSNQNNQINKTAKQHSATVVIYFDCIAKWLFCDITILCVNTATTYSLRSCGIYSCIHLHMYFYSHILQFLNSNVSRRQIEKKSPQRHTACRQFAVICRQDSHEKIQPTRYIGSFHKLHILYVFPIIYSFEIR